MHLLASGRDADVYAIGAGRVLRRYRHGGDVSAEAAVMAYLGELGFPVPRVYAATDGDLVMERLDGPTMGRAFMDGDLEAPSGAEILADLHTRLHALPARPGADPGYRILHLDLHPDNVILASRGPVLIDWRNSAAGPPDLDVAMSALILAQVAVDEQDHRAGGAGALLSGFLRRAGGNPRRMLDRAVAMRAADPALTAGEVDRIGAAAALVRAGA